MSAPKIEIYTKWGCPYCVAAKALLDRKGVPYEEYDITMGGPKRTEMPVSYTHLTLPTIYSV